MNEAIRRQTNQHIKIAYDLLIRSIEAVCRASANLEDQYNDPRREALEDARVDMWRPARALQALVDTARVERSSRAAAGAPLTPFMIDALQAPTTNAPLGPLREVKVRKGAALGCTSLVEFDDLTVEDLEADTDGDDQ